MSDNRTIDGNGAAHHGKGIKGAGEFAPSLDAEQPGAVTLARKVEPVRSPSRELSFQIAALQQQTIAVQTREDLQTTLRNLREINPALTRIELADDGEGIMFISGAWDSAGEDISESDWFGDGRDRGIWDLTDEGGDQFPITARFFDYDGSPMSTIATANDEHLAWDVDVDKALATNAADPEATTALERLKAISSGSRALKAALEKVQIAEGHAHINAVQALSNGLNDDARMIVITEVLDDDAGPEAELTDAEGWTLENPGAGAEEITDLASNINCPLYELRDHGTFEVDYERGINKLIIRFTR